MEISPGLSPGPSKREPPGLGSLISVAKLPWLNMCKNGFFKRGRQGQLGEEAMRLQKLSSQPNKEASSFLKCQWRNETGPEGARPQGRTIVVGEAHPPSLRRDRLKNRDFDFLGLVGRWGCAGSTQLVGLRRLVKFGRQTSRNKKVTTISRFRLVSLSCLCEPPMRNGAMASSPKNLLRANLATTI